MKNLTPKRREEIGNRIDMWNGNESVDLDVIRVSPSELRTLLAASELLDAAMAENRAWRAMHCECAIGDLDEEVACQQRIDEAREATDTTAARLGWEQEGR